MNKKMYMLMVICIVAISSNTIIASPWSWVKDKMRSAWVTYKRWNIPRPHLIKYQILELDGKNFEEFSFDTSQDSEYVKEQRIINALFGIYVSEEIDPNFYLKYLKNTPIPFGYVDQRIGDNKIRHVEGAMSIIFNLICSLTLLKEGLSMQVKTMDPVLLEAHQASLADIMNTAQQFLWEIEYCLPKIFDNEISGKLFIAFVKRHVQLYLIRKDTAKERYLIAETLDMWKNYTLRFVNNRGLIEAVKKYPFGGIIFEWKQGKYE